MTINITVAGNAISAPINVTNGVTTVVVTGLNAQVLNFVTITGDFGFRKNANGDLEVAGSSASARLEVGTAVKAGVTAATFGLIVKADQKILPCKLLVLPRSRLVVVSPVRRPRA